MNKGYITENLYLAATLVLLGYEIAEVRPSNKRENANAIVFAPADTIHEDVDSYWNDKLNVNPKQLFFHLKELRSRLYDGK